MSALGFSWWTPAFAAALICISLAFPTIMWPRQLYSCPVALDLREELALPFVPPPTFRCYHAFFSTFSIFTTMIYFHIYFVFFFLFYFTSRITHPNTSPFIFLCLCVMLLLPSLSSCNFFSYLLHLLVVFFSAPPNLLLSLGCLLVFLFPLFSSLLL